MTGLRTFCVLALAGFALAGCGEVARLSVAEGTGPDPHLPPPAKTLLPTVNVATAKGWPADAKPVAADGLVVARFAEGLDHPRWLYVLPNGDVLVAETNAPPRPEDGKGIKAAVMKAADEEGGCRGGERKSHHPAA